MFNVKKMIATATSVALCLGCMATVTACRTKDETVITFKNDDKTYEVKAGTYLCNLLGAYSNFRSTYDDQLESQSSTTADNFKYEKQTLEDKDYNTWIKEKCYDFCAGYAYIEMEFDRLGLKLDDSTKSGIEQYASQYWASGNKSVYEANGVSYDTYTKYFLNQNAKTSKVFDYYYGSHTKAEKAKDSRIGSLRPSDNEIKNELKKQYTIADTISVSLTKSDSSSSDVVSLTDDEKKAAKKKLEDYAKKYNSGKMTFAQIYKDHNGSDIKNSSTTAKDKYATVYGSSDSSNPSDYFDEINKSKAGQAVVLEFADCYMLSVKKDILADNSYFEQYSDSLVQSMKYEEFTNNCIETAKKYKVEKNESAMNYYSANKVKIPTQKAANTSSAY